MLEQNFQAADLGGNNSVSEWRLHWLEAEGELQPWRTQIISEIKVGRTAISRLISPPRLDILVQRRAGAVIQRVVILTAVEVETRALLRHIPDWTDETVRGTVFYRGELDQWDIAIAEVGPGNNPAAAIAERAIQHFQPQVALFVGVAGGIGRSWCISCRRRRRSSVYLLPQGANKGDYTGLDIRP
jgi:hypothetical protein